MRTAAIRQATAATAGWLAVAILAAFVALAPWAYGGVEHRFQAWVAAAFVVGVVAVGLQVVIVERAVSGTAVTIAIFPLAGLAALAALQGWCGLPANAAETSIAVPISIYPADTRVALASLLAAVAAALIGAVACSREPAFRVTLGLCLLSAAVVGFLGIAMKLTGDDRVIRGTTFIGDPFARFVNRNNGCAYLVAGMAAGLALLRASITRDMTEGGPDFRSRSSWRLDRTTRILIVSTLISICLAGVIASRSRGGTIAAFVTLVTAFAFFKAEGWTRRLLLFGPLTGVAVALVMWVGLSSSTVERFQSLSAETVFQEGRLPHWRNAMGAVAARPYFGSGIGTYGFAHQAYATQPEDGWYEHADNQFVEVLVEAGLVGAAIIVAIALLMLISLCRGRTDPAASTLVASLVAGQAAHALFDYGIVVPAVLLLVVTLWGAGIVRLWQATGEQASFRRQWPGRVVLASVAILLTAGLVWSFQEQRSAAAVEKYATAATGTDRPGGLSVEQVQALIAGLSPALEQRPDDAVGHRELARLYLYRYRMAATEAVRRVDGTLSEAEAWRAASPIRLHKAVNQLARAGAFNGVASLRQDALAQRDLVPARNHLLESDRWCGRVPGVHLPLAALSFLEEQSPAGTEHLEKALERFPTDADMLRTAGRMAWQAGDKELAARCWKASFGMSTTGFGSTSRLLLEEVGPEETVAVVLPDAPGAVLALIIDPQSVIDERLHQALSTKLDELARGLPDGQLRRRTEANALWLRGDVSDATERFGELTRSRPLDVDLRVNHAMFLKAQGRWNDARDEVAVALALAPQRSQLRHLLATWDAESQHKLNPRGQGSSR